MEIIIDENPISEGLATLIYFIKHTEFARADEPIVIIDVGGGSTEIAAGNKSQIIFHDSVKFAGNDFLKSSPILLQEVIDDKINNYNDEREFIEKITIFNSKMFEWPFLNPNWGGELERKKNQVENFNLEIKRNLSIFFGSILFYVGLHFKEYDNLRINQIAFAGNGIKFLELLTHSELSEKVLDINYKNFLKEMLLANSNIKNIQQEITFIFTKDPKWEVVKGLIYKDDFNQLLSDKEKTKKMFGLDFKLNNQHYPYNSWDQNLRGSDFGKNPLIDFSILNNFIDNFNSNISKFDITLQINPNIISQKEFKDRLINSLINRGNNELATPIFFEAIKVILYLINYYNNGK